MSAHSCGEMPVMRNSRNGAGTSGIASWILAPASHAASCSGVQSTSSVRVEPVIVLVLVISTLSSVVLRIAFDLPKSGCMPGIPVLRCVWLGGVGLFA